jgi:hypothetical protein
MIEPVSSPLELPLSNFSSFIRCIIQLVFGIVCAAGHHKKDATSTARMSFSTDKYNWTFSVRDWISFETNVHLVVYSNCKFKMSRFLFSQRLAMKITSRHLREGYNGLFKSQLLTTNLIKHKNQVKTYYIFEKKT